IVADKTGYPVEMLNLDMELDSDLGIDSIKRVEIFASLMDQAPALEKLDTTELAKRSSLRQIVEYVSTQLGSAIAPAAQANAAPKVDIETSLLQIVADKTGYPVEMLNLDMELDSDLGIDSIKRVEIFAGLIDQSPLLEKLDTTELSKRSSLRQIVEYVSAQLGAADATTMQYGERERPAPHADELPIETTLLQVVADKTGYPVEMLNLEMELDSDLGIDSIKRVEIFAALMEQAPALQAIDTTELAKRGSLRQIVEYTRAQLRGEAEATTATVSTPVTTALPSTTPAIERFVLEWRDAAATGWTPAALQAGANVLISDDGTGVAPVLAALFTERGFNARVMQSATECAQADAVIFLGGLAALTTPNDAFTRQREAFQLARAFASTAATRACLFVTVQDTGGRFSLAQSSERAWLGGLTGLVKTAALEWPQAFVKAIDLERGARSPEQLATVLADELLFGGMETEVGLCADGTRGTLVSVAQAIVQSDAPALPKGAVIVASGGARGVTATSLIALAQAIQPRFVLLGRTPLENDPICCAGIEDEASLKRTLLHDAQTRGEHCTPATLQARMRQVQANREIRATLQEMQHAGAEARYVAVDIRNVEAVSQVLNEVRAEWGPIAGLIHGAGVIADKLIAEKTDEQFAQVFATKVEGLQALLHATTNDPLHFIGLFSSVAGRAGNIGQCDYAMANETLNKMAALEAARRNCRVKSFNWGPWEGGMVTPQLKARFDALGVPLIPLPVGAQMFVDEVLHDASDNIEIVIGGKPAGSLLPANEAALPSKEVRLHVSATNYEWLRGHQIKGETVVPFTLVHEWFYRVAQSLRPDLRVTAIREMQACKGIVLPDFERGDETLTLQFTPLQSSPNGAQFNLKLSGSNGTLHYHALAVLQAHTTAAAAAAPLTGNTAWPLPEIYDGDVLFHQDAFRVIQSVQSVEATSLSGTLQSALPDKAARRTVLLDGALQLAVLWHWQHVGGGSLPTAITALKVYADFDTAPITCEVRGRDNGWQRSLSDLILRNGTGAIVAEIQGLELVTYFQKELAMEAAQ
ncbi:MAG TPA: SDR family NAD(P)-dependent oxidoreductase, partial [Blastocatellia bacterium]|nr:SDR family NAD(P)-dependent oxidoreductase [Blastocatellia bacterium]